MEETIITGIANKADVSLVSVFLGTPNSVASGGDEKEGTQSSGDSVYSQSQVDCEQETRSAAAEPYLNVPLKASTGSTTQQFSCDWLYYGMLHDVVRALSSSNIRIEWLNSIAGPAFKRQKLNQPHAHLDGEKQKPEAATTQVSDENRAPTCDNVVCFLIDTVHANAITELCKSLAAEGKITAFYVNFDVAIVSVIGRGIGSNNGVMCTILSALSNNRVPILSFVTAPLSVRLLVRKQDVTTALIVLHSALGLDAAEQQ
jgi:hypothetical protein